MTPKKILILYADVGHGHKKIAYNIADALQRDGHRVELKSILEVQKGRLSEYGTKIYLYIIFRLPWLWSFMYLNKLFIACTLPFRTFAARFNSGEVKEILSREQYDLVICTQVTASATLSYLKSSGFYKGKFATTFSDFHLHHFWIHKNTDLFVANIDEQKAEMVSLGYDPKKIIVAGITLKPKPEISRSEARAKFGIGQNEKAALVFGGSLGYGFGFGTIHTAAAVADKVLVICGGNKNLEAAVRKEFSGSATVQVFGYVDNVPDFYAAVDAVVTKPGGLSTTECLQWQLPIIANSYFAGQEELNFTYLITRKLILDGTKDLHGTLQHELETGTFARQLKENPFVGRVVGDGHLVREAVGGL